MKRKMELVAEEGKNARIKYKKTTLEKCESVLSTSSSISFPFARR